MKLSLKEFFKLIYPENNLNYTGFKIEVPDSAKVLISTYVKDLVDKAQDLGPEVTENPTFKDRYSLNHTIYSGMEFGTDVINHIIALFGNEFKSVIPLIISKVRLDNLQEANKGIGRQNTIDTADSNDYKYYLLIDNSELGVNREMLKEFGLGDAIGCPASLKPSEETRQYLLKRGIDVSKSTMLQEYAEILSTKFNECIVTLFKTLTIEEQEKIFGPIDTKLLSGELLREVRQRRPKVPWIDIFAEDYPERQSERSKRCPHEYDIVTDK